MKQERVQKLIAQAGVASRREAEKLINEQKVKVNNRIITLGDKASFDDQIKVNNKIINKQAKIYYLINKPQRTLTSCKKQDDRLLVTELIDNKKYIFPVGRLDYNTTGTLLLTNDGELAYRLMHPKYQILRVYEAEIDRNLSDQELKSLNLQSLTIENKFFWHQVTKCRDKTYTVKLKQGMNHHVKKLFAIVGADVKKLTRLQFANLTHQFSLQEGQYRKLKITEIKELKKLVNLT